MNIKEFIKKINEEQPANGEYIFLMETSNEEYELEPVYNKYDEVHSLEIKDRSEDITDEFSLTEITAAYYTMKKMDKVEDSNG